MENINTLKTKLGNIGEAIRSKSGKSGKLSLDGMVKEINNLSACDWKSLSPSISTKIDKENSTINVIRSGDIVMVDASIRLLEDVISGDLLLSIDDFIQGKSVYWRCKETSIINVLGVHFTSSGSTYELGFVRVTEGKSYVNAWTNFIGCDAIEVSFCYEAEPLT